MKIGLCIKYFQVFLKMPKKMYNTRMFESNWKYVTTMQQSQESNVLTMQISQRKNKNQWAYKNIHEDNSFVY